MFRLAPVALIAAVALAGCTSPAPEPTEAAPSPSQTVAPSDGPPSVVITADGFQVRDAAGDVTTTIELGDDSQSAVDALTAAFGTEPTESSFEVCGDTVFDWDGVQVYVLGHQPAAPFVTTQLIVETASIGDVAVATDSGFAVGDPAADIIAALPADQEWGNGTSFIWDKLSDVGTGAPGATVPFGGFARVDDSGNVSRIVPKSDGEDFRCD